MAPCKGRDSSKAEGREGSSKAGKNEDHRTKTKAKDAQAEILPLPVA